MGDLTVLSVVGGFLGVHRYFFLLPLGPSVAVPTGAVPEDQDGRREANHTPTPPKEGPFLACISH